MLFLYALHITLTVRANYFSWCLRPIQIIWHAFSISLSPLPKIINSADLWTQSSYLPYYLFLLLYLCCIKHRKMHSYNTHKILSWSIKKYAFHVGDCKSQQKCFFGVKLLTIKTKHANKETRVGVFIRIKYLGNIEESLRTLWYTTQKIVSWWLLCWQISSVLKLPEFCLA